MCFVRVRVCDVFVAFLENDLLRIRVGRFEVGFVLDPMAGVHACQLKAAWGIISHFYQLPQRFCSRHCPPPSTPGSSGILASEYLTRPFATHQLLEPCRTAPLSRPCRLLLPTQMVNFKSSFPRGQRRRCLLKEVE